MITLLDMICWILPQTKLVHFSTATWPVAPGASGVAAPGAPPWAAAIFADFSASIETNTAAIAANTAAIAANTAATAANTTEVNMLLHRTSSTRTVALKRNSKALDLSHPLVPVPHPDTGVMPPLETFPVDISALRQMPSTAVNALLAFYDQPILGVSLVERRRQLADALGCDG